MDVKRIELVIEAHEKNNVIKALKDANVHAFTIYKHVGGYGERGQREENVFGDMFENVTFVIACKNDQLESLLEALRPMLKQYGGMCLISDAKWLKH